MRLRNTIQRGSNVMTTKSWLVLLVLISGFVLVSWHQEIFHGISVLTAEDGQIIVNSPTVYTRQRLVNDRLAQTAWLEGQLSVTNSESNEPFRSIDEVRVRTVSKTTDLVLGPDRASGRTPTSPAEATKINASESKEPASTNHPSESKEPAVPVVDPTTSDLFRAKNTYREEVRAAMMETQLDDRHDIRGNTIYRLAFDAAVLTGTKKDSLAVITVKVGHDHTDARFAKDYKELYEEWLRQMQKVLDGSVNGVSLILINRLLAGDSRLQLTLPTVISRGVCWYLTQMKLIPISSSAKAQNNYEGDEGVAQGKLLDEIKVPFGDVLRLKTPVEVGCPQYDKYDSPWEGFFGGILLHEKLSQAWRYYK
jgi:hypothetical protein